MDETPPSEMDDPEAPETVGEPDLQALLARLETEHRAIDREIDAMVETGVMDMLKIKRMKKVKLAMKDRIVFLRNQLTPDIIA